MRVIDSLEKPRTIVVGGSGSLGREIVSTLTERNHDVINLDLTKRGEARWIELDLKSDTSTNSGIDRAAELLGGIDVFVQAAGAYHAEGFFDVGSENFREILDVNLIGSFRAAQAAATHMRESGGRILFISSIHAQHGVQGRLTYAASKAGIESMTRVMAAELSSLGIRVNAIAPGAVDGGMTASGIHRSDWEAVTLAGRKVSVKEVANLVALMTSDDASFVSGQVIAQDGGVSSVQMFR